jgi:hypothetical protein
MVCTTRSDARLVGLDQVLELVLSDHQPAIATILDGMNLDDGVAFRWMPLA